jgi:hypothetical protein
VCREPGSAQSLEDFFPPRGFLLGTEDMFHRPAGDGPGELFFRRQLAIRLDGLKRIFHHFPAISLQDVFHPIGIAEIEMRFEDDPNVFHLGLRFGPRRRNGCSNQQHGGQRNDEEMIFSGHGHSPVSCGKLDERQAIINPKREHYSGHRVGGKPNAKRFRYSLERVYCVLFRSFFKRMISAGVDLIDTPVE